MIEGDPMFMVWMKKSCLFAGVFLLCFAQELTWVYGQDNSAYRVEEFREPAIRVIDRQLEFAIGAPFSVEIDFASSIQNVRVRFFRGNRETLNKRGSRDEQECVTFSSVVVDLIRSNGHVEWQWHETTSPPFRPEWLNLVNDSEGGEELVGQNYYFKFEFKDNNIPSGDFRLLNKNIKDYFKTGFPMKVVPRLVGSKGAPTRGKMEEWVSTVKQSQAKNRNQNVSSLDCIKFVESHNENLKVANAFKCHELKT